MITVEPTHTAHWINKIVESKSITWTTLSYYPHINKPVIRGIATIRRKEGKKRRFEKSRNIAGIAVLFSMLSNW